MTCQASTAPASQVFKKEKHYLPCQLETFFQSCLFAGSDDAGVSEYEMYIRSPMYLSYPIKNDTTDDKPRTRLSATRLATTDRQTHDAIDLRIFIFRRKRCQLITMARPTPTSPPTPPAHAPCWMPVMHLTFLAIALPSTCN